MQFYSNFINWFKFWDMKMYFWDVIASTVLDLV